MELLIYLAKASLLLTLFWVVYKVFLEADTFHRWKRIYLHLGYGLSLILPLLSYTKIEIITISPSFLAPSSSEFVPAQIEPTTTELIWSFISDNAVIELLYIGISLVFFVHLLVKFYRLLKFLKSSKAFQTEGIFHIQKSIPEGAFSFLNYIVYDPEVYSEAELKIILEHEKAHVAHKHSLDILFAHLYKCAFWFNPFAWLYQKSLVLNLEYEADAKVVDKTTKRDYQMTLYSITQQQFKSQLQHSFHQSPIKKRIAMLNKNKHNRSFWKLFIVSPFLVVFFLLFQVETKAQIKEPVTTSETKVNRIEITYDENTTRETLNSDREFLKEEFNIDVSYSMLKFTSDRKLKSITLDVDCNDGFKGSVTSPNVEKLPVYFYRDYSEGVKNPFGVGTKRDDEQTALTEPEDFKDVETFIINKQKFDKSELLNKYIPVKQYTHMEGQNTLYITTRSEFSKPYYDRLFEAKDELNALFEQGEKPEGVVYYKVEDDGVIVMTINNFKISDNRTSPIAVTKVKSEADFDTDFNTIKDAENFIINGKKIDKEELAKTYIPVERYSYDDGSKTLSITTRPEFSKTYYSKISAITEELVDKFGKNITEKMTFINVSSDHEPILITLDKFKISESEENASQYHGSAPNYINRFPDQNILFILDGKEIEESLMSSIEPDEIKSVTVIKDSKQLKAEGYNPKEVEGLIKIKTKKDNDINASQYSNSDQVYRTYINQQNVVFVVDGKEIERKDFNKIDPEQIKSMFIIKTPYELKKAGYDHKKIDGVIQISTKKSDPDSNGKIKIK